MLYKQQLTIINDRVILNRKKFLTMNANEAACTSSSLTNQTNYTRALKKYKKRPNIRVHLKRKFNRNNEQNSAHLECKYNDNDVNCNNSPLPLTSYCKKRMNLLIKTYLKHYNLFMIFLKIFLMIKIKFFSINVREQ